MTKSRQPINAIQLYPIGHVRNELTAKSFAAETTDDPQPRAVRIRLKRERIRKTESELVIRREFEALLEGIASYSHIWVLFWPHLLPENERRLKKVHPLGVKEIPLQGIFATRSPARPNPILISNVRLLECRNNVLRVMGLDALDGSPIVDIKPVTLQNSAMQDVSVPDWMTRLYHDLEQNPER